MATPEPVDDDEIAAAGDAMIMLITRSTWETLCRQGAAEGTTAGIVLQKAIANYLRDHGSEDAMGYLRQVAEGYRR